jgi:hypothetical protein
MVQTAANLTAGKGALPPMSTGRAQGRWSTRMASACRLRFKSKNHKEKHKEKPTKKNPQRKNKKRKQCAG